MSKYQRYPKYKDSGVKWLGEIPNHWTATNLKYIANVNMGQSPSSTTYNNEGIGTEFLQGNADFGDKYPTARTYTTDPKKISKSKDILFTVRAPVGAMNIGKRKYAIGRGLCAINSTNQTTNAFLWWLMPIVKFELDTVATGSTYEAVSVEQVNNAIILLPSLQEQQTIATYLDKAIAKIYTLIEKQTKLIELLKEKRQAVISTAVTRGLDSSVPMKDSGVEWLGEIPERWTLPKLSLLSSNVGDGLHGTPKYVESSVFSFINGNNLVDGEIQFKVSTKYVSEQEYIKYKKPLNLTTLLLSINGTIGSMAFYNNELVMLGKSSAYINCMNTLSRKYLFYFLQSSQNKQYFDLELTGTTIYNLSLETIRKTPIPLPSLKEQQVIENYLDDKTSKIDNLITKATKAIDLLKERRTALISAVVTGKIDVRGEV